MNRVEVKGLSVEQLKQKGKSLKMFIGLFIFLIAGLYYFIISDYLKGGNIDWSIVTIAICALAGPATLYPQLKEVQKELKTRK